MTDSNPHYINELQSDLRCVKEGWYVIDERGTGPIFQSGDLPDENQPSSELGRV
jgi:hypothetical protein